MLVILHGWSDTSRSFARLGRRLVVEGVVSDVKHVRLGNYVSMDDDVTFDDLAMAMEKAWEKEKLPTKRRSVDVLIHSTGALVVRHWLTMYRTPETNPIFRFVMLAPANFGSPLAHKGRSFLGRVIKGFKSDKPFQTGTGILKGLELASPFTWDLALRDRLGDQTWYGPDRMLASVVVGTTGYSGISAAANENGTDGTVRVSTANLDPVFLRLDFASEPLHPVFTSQKARGRVAFARVTAENHSTIALKDGGPRTPETFELIRQSLEVKDATFESHVEAWEKLACAAREAAVDAGSRFRHPYQNTVIRLVDHLGHPIRDFFLEVFMKKVGLNKEDGALTKRIQERVIDTVHTYEDLPSNRSLLFNTAELFKIVAETGRPIYMAVTAAPDIRKTKTVGYSTFGYMDIGSIEIQPDLIETFFQPDRTLLVELILRREQADSLFTFRPLE
jgi:hypothetical protein